MNGLVRFAPWVTLTGVFALLSGLIRDARMHRLDPGLAAREGVFTMANPAHRMFALGLALTVVGTVLFLLGKASRRSGSSPALRAFSVVVAGLLVVMSLATFAAAVSGGSHDASHQHGQAPTVQAPAAQTTATPEQKAAADKLFKDVKTSLSRYTDVNAALAQGYKQTTPYRFLRWGPAHYHNYAYNRDDGLLDPARPESLVYMKLPGGEIVLIGAMFLAPKGQGPRPGGPITDWHVHDNLCVTATGSVALATGPGQCPAGTFFVGEAVEMIHVWIFDHPGGPYAHDMSPQAIQAALRQFGAGR